jgi:26S proteasome regulatory subunit N2
VVQGGAAAAAGVLTAADEDEEGEDAEVPGDFDYHSDTVDEEHDE